MLADVCARWRVNPGPVLGDRPSGTWSATRGAEAYVVKYFDFLEFSDWRYPLYVAAALRRQGWPTPEQAEDPIVGTDGAWVLFHRLPGQAYGPGDDDRRARGRLLAELHEGAAATGITRQRGGFPTPAEVVADPSLDGWLRRHESRNPEEGRLLRACRDETAEWFAAHPAADAPTSVIHGDFAPWNLLFHEGKLTGLIDFEASHHSFQVADFALSWRGYQDDVLRGYDEVRPLSDLEWHLVRPVFQAWLFLGLKDLLATSPPSLAWQIAHLRKHSALLAEKTG